jgi:N-acetylneuraminate synthase
MKEKAITIAGRNIGHGHPPFIIAELSANHNGDLAAALSMIDMAKARGADAVKIQTYRPDTITLNADTPDFIIKGGLWHGRKLYDLYEEAHTPWEWHGELFAQARKAGITLFSSPFDTTAVDLLEDLGAPAYKIASFEAVDLPLIRYAAGTGKPMVISTGMADADEIGEAVAAARDGGCREMVLLHCVSGYPAPAQDYALATLSDMGRKFGVPVGLSDHTLDNTTAIAAVALGAVVIEKHVTLDRQGGGPDDSFSLEPPELEELCRTARTAWKAIGEVNYGRKSSEKGNVQFRRSLYFVRDLPAGAVVPADAVRSVRPGHGLPPKRLPDVIGATLARPVKAATPVREEDLAARHGQ